MQLSAEEFLDSIRNKSTRKGYRNGIKKFCQWFDKSPDEILEFSNQTINSSRFTQSVKITLDNCLYFF